MAVAAAQQAAPATTRAITTSDLRARLEILAADSLMGREAGSRGAWVASAIIADWFLRAGLQPAGDSGTYFQVVPVEIRRVDPAAAISVEGVPLVLWTDFVPVTGGRGLAIGPPRAVNRATVVFGGTLGDTAHMIASAAGAGRVVVLAAPRAPDGSRSPYYSRAAGLQRYPQASALAIVVLDIYPRRLLEALRDGTPQAARVAGAAPVPAAMLISEYAAGILLGRPLWRARPGDVGQTLRGSLGAGPMPAPYPARNVIAILPGADPDHRHQYVALSAHHDHIGFSHHPVDIDPLRRAPMGAPGAGRSTDSTVPRRDSIYNGADDDGSGTVALVEIAEELAAAPPRPSRSILFVSHTAEEIGLVGSAWFAAHATVPRDSIMAEIDLDMVGRGTAADVKGGGPSYLELVGSRRLSKEFGAITDSVAARQTPPFVINYAFDAPGHPDNDYCRADHFSYARYGIPALNMSRGEHLDYHEVTDEPQYIDYDDLARVARFAEDLAVTLADLDHPLVVDHPRPDPNAPCVQ